MKSKLFIGIALLMLGFSSCKRTCTVCSKSGEPNMTYCQKEYDSPAGYNSAIERRESWGYSCLEEVQ